MPTSRDENRAKEKAILELERLNQLTGLMLRLEQPEKWIVMHDNNSPAG